MQTHIRLLIQGVTVKNPALAIWSAFANAAIWNIYERVDSSCSIAPQDDFEMISQQNESHNPAPIQ